MSARKYDLSWMPLHVADWRASDTVRVLTLAGKGAYMELLMSQWRAEADGLPADAESLRLIVQWTGKGWDRVWALLEPHFPIGLDGRRRNLRVEAERAKVMQQRVGQSRGGLVTAGKAAGKLSRSSQGSIPGVEGEAFREAEPVSRYAATQVLHCSTSAAEVQHRNPNPNPNSTASDEAVWASTASSVGIADQFEHPDHRQAYLDYRRSHRNPRGFDATLGMMVNGPAGPGGRAATMWQLGSALADAAGNGTEFNAQHFRGFLAKAPRERPAAKPLTLMPTDEPGTVRDEHGKVVWTPGDPPMYQPTPEQVAANGWSVAA